MPSYDERAFTERIEAARKHIRTVLDHTRNPQRPADVPHRYDDKFLLAEFVTRTAVAAVVQALEAIGLTAAQAAELRAWAKTRAVTLRLIAHEDCRFLREERRKVESSEYVSEVKGTFGSSTRSEKIITTIVEYRWAFEFEYELVAFPGTATDRALVVAARKGQVELTTTTDQPPRPRTVVRPPVDVNLTWLFAHQDAEGRAAFAIDRTAPTCHTPRRNAEIDDAVAAAGEVATWCAAVAEYFRGHLFTAQPEHGLDLAAIDDREVFVPVLPLLEDGGADGVLPLAYLHAFLAEAQRTLTAKRRALDAAFPRDASVITAVEAGLLVALLHARRVCGQLVDSVDHLEALLRQQLVAAIGKELTPADFTAYMDFHHRKLVAPAFRPLPFSYAIRRPDHDPEGVVAIEAGRAGASEPIATTVRRIAAARPMSFGLDAATRVTFHGERYLHAWVSHQFSGQAPAALQLVARARQFSSFVLLVGRISSADTFEPRLGLIVQNKDLVKLPLLLEQLPTPKEFRDAIESLSPEQQRFAKAFRGMQLESTLFAVCVIQIKPQLEKLLRLPPDSLTKEIRLTQELLDLFIEYQLPSDLLSYDGPADLPAADKLERVKQYVARMYEMIERSKARELEQEREREALRLAQLDRSPPPMPFGGPPAMPGGAPEGTRGRGSRPAPPPPGMPGMAGPVAMPVSVGYSMSAPPPAPPPPPPSAAPAPVAVAAPAPVATPPPRRQPGEPAPTDPSAAASAGDREPADYTRLPAELDRRFESLDTDGALRATILNPGEPWTRTAQPGLLSAPTTATLSAADRDRERHRAFDLLDALTRSGSLAIDDASLHVILAATHCFDRTLVETVIADNVNPIEKVERSLMIVGATIHGRPVDELVAPEHHARFFATSPGLAPSPALPDGASSPAT